jgi:hypothetical protein
MGPMWWLSTVSASETPIPIRLRSVRWESSTPVVQTTAVLSRSAHRLARCALKNWNGRHGESLGESEKCGHGDGGVLPLAIEHNCLDGVGVASKTTACQTDEPSELGIAIIHPLELVRGPGLECEHLDKRSQARVGVKSVN